MLVRTNSIFFLYFIIQIILSCRPTFYFSFQFALVEFDDSCDESDTLIEVIPSKWLFDNNTKCKYPPKKDKLKTTRLVMSRIDPGQDWDIYNLRLHHYYSNFLTFSDIYYHIFYV